ncbi:bypass of stop codon protein 1 [Drosophila rhopaloa]|uniref:Bypass of stop codon protein 1 n=1 Tax=Drosophila rhopaloa TaxID=1041015 RepID=A0A6P4FL03_DRORH|nr:bypass of stop codon protein 1 [Drosophila rhopaloa]
MQSHLIAILLATVAIGSCLANPSLISGPSRMLEIMSATSEMQRNNPQLASACFAYYNDVFKSDYDVYEREYNQCLDRFNGGRDEVLRRYNPVVWDLSNSTFDSCAYLLDCDNLTNSQDSLNCYANEGPKRSKELTTVSANASTSFGSLTQEVEQLSFTRELCCNSSARNYEVRSGESYDSFQSCLAGQTPVPQITTTTPAPITTTPNTTTTSTTTTNTTSKPTTTPSTTSSTTSGTIASHVGDDESNSGHSKHRWGNKLNNIFKHV